MLPAGALGADVSAVVFFALVHIQRCPRSQSHQVANAGRQTEGSTKTFPLEV